MGWRDINLNRRKPRIDVAVVPMAAGEPREAAVLRKVVGAALAAIAGQGGGSDAFAAGYAAGFARQQALKHGVDTEADGGVALLAALGAQAPHALAAAVAAISFVPRQAGSPRAALAAEDPLADAGYLVGQLDALCNTRKLLRRDSGVVAYLTLCDHVADRLQTHQPTAALRLAPAERAIVERALAGGTG